MEGICITYVYPEKEEEKKDYRDDFDKKGEKSLDFYCANLMEKIKIIQSCEERNWELDISLFEKPPTIIKTGYVTTKQEGADDRFVFIRDHNNEKCTVISDTTASKVLFR